MNNGLSDKQLKEIVNVLCQYKAVDKSVLFGSRAMGSYKKGSDVDITIMGENADFTLAAKIKSHLEDDTYLPYFFDVISYNTIKSDELKEHIKRYGKTILSGENNIPNGWVETTLGEVVDIFNQKRIPLSTKVRNKRKGIYPYYGASNIVDFIDDYIFDGEYLLISEDGENLNTRNTPIAFIAKGKFWVNNHAHIVKGKYPHLTKYLGLYFSKLDISAFITGAVQPKLSKGNLVNIPITIPKSIAEQKAIAQILTAFDDKIELLQAQNKTLETTAQTIFKEWFGKYQIGDELPEGWRMFQ
ncbi:Type I restriction-modification system, specificity subunit S (EC, partial [uncultured Gammaproteobacteria bacterium]